MSKKMVKVWTSRINRDLVAMGRPPISTSQFRKCRTGIAVLDEIIEVIVSGGVEYSTG